MISVGGHFRIVDAPRPAEGASSNVVEPMANNGQSLQTPAKYFWPEEEFLLSPMRGSLAVGLPLFPLDYAMKSADRALVYRQAPCHGLVPMMTGAALPRLTGAPSPWQALKR